MGNRTESNFLALVYQILGIRYNSVTECPNILLEFEQYVNRKFIYRYVDTDKSFYFHLKLDLTTVLEKKVELFDLISNYGLKRLDLYGQHENQFQNKLGSFKPIILN